MSINGIPQLSVWIEELSVATASGNSQASNMLARAIRARSTMSELWLSDREVCLVNQALASSYNNFDDDGPGYPVPVPSWS